MKLKQNHKHSLKFSVMGVIKRAILEYKYFTCKNWTLKEVGEFWSKVTDYDEINENSYSYYRRFTNSWDLAKNFVKDGMIMLDIQSRTGKGTEFWFQKGLIKKAYLVDFSDYLLGIARERLRGVNFSYEFFKVLDYTLPFNDSFFDLIITYETIEHMGNVDTFFNELSRVLKPKGIIILTCPNMLWEPAHWLSAIFNLHHSEGPHNFLSRGKLINCFKKNKMEILAENSTIIFPFNNRYFIACDRFLERVSPQFIKSYLALRRTFVLRKL